MDNENLGLSASVSVIVPYFNDSETIYRALASVCSQTEGVYEIIIVDDCSTDREYARLCEVVDRFDGINIRVFRFADNKGPSAARNIGWDNAAGKYIAFLDSDDSWHSDKLRLQLEHMRLYPDTAILGTMSVLRGSMEGPVRDIPRLSWVSPTTQIFRNRFVTSSVLLHRNIESRFREDLRYSEDNELWCRILYSRSTSGAVMKESLCIHHKPARSRSGASGHFIRMFSGQLKGYRALWSDGLISFPVLLLSASSSAARFVLRLVRVALSGSKRVRANRID